jgi:hypothetical protein
MTTKRVISNEIENKNRHNASLFSKKRNLETYMPNKLKPFIQLSLLVTLLFLVTGCTSGKTSEDSLVSGIIRELNSQRNLTIYDDIERIIFAPDNSDYNINNSKITTTSASEHNLNGNLSNENKSVVESVKTYEEIAKESDKNTAYNKNSSDSFAPKIIAPLVISLNVGDPLKLDYHVYDLDSDYIKVWIDGWVDSANYQTKKGDEGVHSVYIYASDYDSTAKARIIVNVIREQKLSDIKITHQII